MVVNLAMSSKKKIVITGSEGLIGSRLKEYFGSKYDVLGLDIKLGHDLQDSSFVDKFFKENSGIHGIIVCHAYNHIPKEGSAKIEPIDFPLEEISKFLDINVVSVFDVCRAFIKYNDSGKIINISSLYGTLSPRHTIYNNFTKHLGYSLSKASVVMMSKYLATYYADNFEINTVVLGGVYETSFEDIFTENYKNNVPIKRFMEIGEVPPVFDFLLDENTSYMTGTELVIDGGWTAW